MSCLYIHLYLSSDSRKVVKIKKSEKQKKHNNTNSTSKCHVTYRVGQIKWGQCNFFRHIKTRLKGYLLRHNSTQLDVELSWVVSLQTGVYSDTTQLNSADPVEQRTAKSVVFFVYDVMTYKLRWQLFTLWTRRTSSWVELCRYKHSLTEILKMSLVVHHLQR